MNILDIWKLVWDSRFFLNFEEWTWNMCGIWLGVWLTNKYQSEHEYRRLWRPSLCTSSAEWMYLRLQVCSTNSKHIVNRLSHALSCMLTRANHLPWHCDLLELRIKDFILKMPRGKTEVPSWITMLMKAKVNAWKPIVFLFDFLFKEEKEKNTTKYKSW